jgi:hypothetical protein
MRSRRASPGGCGTRPFHSYIHRAPRLHRTRHPHDDGRVAALPRRVPKIDQTWVYLGAPDHPRMERDAYLGSSHRGLTPPGRRLLSRQTDLYIVEYPMTATAGESHERIHAPTLRHGQSTDVMAASSRWECGRRPHGGPCGDRTGSECAGGKQSSRFSPGCATHRERVSRRCQRCDRSNGGLGAHVSSITIVRPVV